MLSQTGANWRLITVWVANVAPGGSQDYKQYSTGDDNEAMGNFNYGATGNVLLSDDPLMLCSAAGIVQLLLWNPRGSDGGIPFILLSYGDSNDDQSTIKDGRDGGN
jgi:hypothetical protein